MTCDAEQIRQFVLGRLPPARAEQLLAHAEQCRHCAETLNAMLYLREHRQELRQALAREERSPMPVQARNARWWLGSGWRQAPIPVWRIALALSVAAIIVFGSVAVLWRRLQEPVQLASLATAERFPYEPFLLRSPQDSIQESFRQAIQSYEQNDVAAAIRQLQEHLRQHPRHADGFFYLGVSHYLAGDPEAALLALQQGLALRSIEPEEKYHWYLAHANLRLNRRQEAVRELRRVIEFDGTFRAAASDLLARISGWP